MMKRLLETGLFLLIIGQIGYMTTYLGKEVVDPQPLFIQETMITSHQSEQTKPVYRLRENLKPYELVYLARKEADKILETGNLDAFNRQLDANPAARMMLGL